MAQLAFESRYTPTVHALEVWWDKSNVTWFLRGQTSLSKLSGALWRRGGKRKKSLQLRLWNLNICVEKVNAKCWLAEMTLLMMSLPLARAFSCFSMFVYICALSHFALIGGIWQISPTGSHRGIGERVERVSSYKLFFLFPPRRQSAPESLLAGHGAILLETGKGSNTVTWLVPSSLSCFSSSSPVIVSGNRFVTAFKWKETTRVSQRVFSQCFRAPSNFWVKSRGGEVDEIRTSFFWNQSKWIGN